MLTIEFNGFLAAFKAHLKTEMFSAAYDTVYNISSATGASDSNSATHGAAYKCF